MTAFISRAYGSKEWEVIIKTDCKEHYEHAELFARKLIDHGKTHPMTNADRIRAMSDEELARVFDRGCPPDRPPKECMKYWHVGCEGCWLEYLQQPVKDGEDDGKSNDPE